LAGETEKINYEDESAFRKPFFSAKPMDATKCELEIVVDIINVKHFIIDL
jgi:hypothetical protein